MNGKGCCTQGVFRSLFKTGIGFGGVVADKDGLIEVFLPFDVSSSEMAAAQIADRYPEAVDESPLTKHAADLLVRYFSGERIVFPLPVGGKSFTPFQREVYKAVLTIPYGEVRSYSGIAADIGRPQSARGVGVAMARNLLPVVIPCHRVVGKSGEMTGYSAAGGVTSKLWLLEMEKRGTEKEKRITRRNS